MTQTIGIIGAGQLGRYLCEAAGPLGLRTRVMTDDPEPPAGAFADSIIRGALDDVVAARELVAASDVVTFEIESVGVAVLEYLADAAARGAVVVRPHAGILLTLRNKALQKAWLVEQGLPTAPFRPYPDTASLRAALAVGAHPYPFVQKTQVGGYDGRGVHIVRGEQDLPGLLPGPCLVEAFVPHVAELGVVVARGADGAVKCYDPVRMRFESSQHILDAALVPAGLSDRLTRAAIDLATRTVAAFDGVGVFALELFQTAEDRLLLNEISPRVHNSGHLTLESCETSQFAQHLRAVAGLPLGPVTLRGPTVMRNLLWRGPTAAAPSVPATVPGSAARVYWYDKAEGRTWRKMGHLTSTGATLAAAEQDAERGCAAVRD
ncbi:MAG: 5-(carboxyamino)imidazole ribonucleotide synthase, partial [Gammaproteobacteria bacterium]